VGLSIQLPEGRYDFLRNSSSTIVSALVPAAIVGNSTRNLEL